MPICGPGSCGNRPFATSHSRGYWLLVEVIFADDASAGKEVKEQKSGRERRSPWKADFGREG